MNTIGLIAGNGIFPIEFAKAARQKGLNVVAVAHEGETSEDLAQWVDAIFWVKVGQLGKIIAIFKEQGVHDVLMAGGIKKTRLFGGAMPDLRGMALLAKMLYKKDDAMLRAVAGELESEGITVRESTLYLDNLLAPAGTLTKRKPSKEELRDIEFGWQMAKEIGRLDIGQTIVVKDQAVLAVEAIEGTVAQDSEWPSVYPVTWSDLDLTTKVAEQLEYHTQDHTLIRAIRSWLRETMDAIAHQRNACMELSGTAKENA